MVTTYFAKLFLMLKLKRDHQDTDTKKNQMERTAIICDKKCCDSMNL